jgi:hypothetical protein
MRGIGFTWRARHAQKPARDTPGRIHLKAPENEALSASLSYEVASDRIRNLGFRPLGSLDDAVDATLARLYRCQSLARP